MSAGVIARSFTLAVKHRHTALSQGIVLALLLAALATSAHAAECETVASSPAEIVQLSVPSCIDGHLQASAEVLVGNVFDLPAAPGGAFAVTVSAQGAHHLELCLADASGERLQCRHGEGEARLVDLAPAPGRYQVRVKSGADEEIGYRLELTASTEPAADAEPNDRLEHASILENGEASGRMVGDEYDYWAFEVTGAPQLWRLEAEGEGLTNFVYYDGSGIEVQRRWIEAGQPLTAMSNLFLRPGRHYLALRGEDASYTVRTVALGPPTGGSELEANDDTTRAGRLRPGETRSGQADANDEDYYRFTLYAEEYVRLELEPEERASLRLYLDDIFESRRDSAPGQATVYEALLHAGDHYVRVVPNGDGSGPYRLTLTRLDPLDLPADLEPNDVDYRAREMPQGLNLRGTLGPNDRYDWYLLPSLDSPSSATLHVTGRPDLRLYEYAEGSRRQLLNVDDVEGEIEVELPAGDDLRLSVGGEGEYGISFRFDPGPAPAPAAADLHLELAAPSKAVAAYWHVGQRVPLFARLENRGAEDAEVELVTRSSHYGWRLRSAETSLRLMPGEEREIELTAEILPDARDDVPVHLTVQARDRSGGGPTASLSLFARCGEPPLRETRLWPLPDPLLGGLDLAWDAFGASLDQRSGTSAQDLIDGMVAPANGWAGRPGDGVTIRLAQRAQLAGVTLNPQSRHGSGNYLEEFEVLASLDGEVFEPVLRGRLGAEEAEQAFVFERPVEASYLRLVALSNQAGDGRAAALGEIKAIAVPGTSRDAQGLNLARTELGGYVAWSRPLHRHATMVLDGNDEDTLVYTADGEEIEWVLGFHNNRAALVSRLGWTEGSRSPERPALARVEVAVSLESPLGPWHSLGEWNVASEQVFEVPEGTWARFVRFRAVGLEQRTYYRLPVRLEVRETPAGGEYRSILGEWGQSRKEAIHEALRPPEPSVALREDDVNDTRESASPLTPGEIVEGRVIIGEDVDWYLITVPQGENALQLTLEGEPVLAARFELLDERGEQVVYDVDGSPSRVVVSALVEPGDYFLRIDEPPRSVVFAWDNSGSMGPYLDIIYQTITGFVADVQPGREVAQLLPFDDLEGPFLLADWSDDPLELMATLNDYDRSAGSSNAEASLLVSARALAEREGTRAVMFMTDAESGGYTLTADLWAALEEARPRVFAFETSSGGSTHTQDLMQSWADAAGGHYDYARAVGDFEAGFARATCHLRRPAHYRLHLATGYREPPGPGLLSVARSAGVADNPPVEIILDLSGSMNKALPQGPSRVEVAKRVLDKLVAQTLPEGTPFALRMYGHLEPNSCHTRLELPLAPLDRERVARKIASAQPKLLSGTPLAESLLAVPGDLRAAGRGALVILLTDGEESCGGDVEGAVQQVRDAGLEVQLHIISFDVESVDAKAEFERWAALAGGRFFDANDEEGLAAALASALAPPFRVVDRHGKVVAHGNVGGDPVLVPPGLFTVEVLTSPPHSFEEVRVRGDDEQQLLLRPE